MKNFATFFEKVPYNVVYCTALFRLCENFENFDTRNFALELVGGIFFHHSLAFVSEKKRFNTSLDDPCLHFHFDFVPFSLLDSNAASSRARDFESETQLSSETIVLGPSLSGPATN